MKALEFFDTISELREYCILLEKSTKLEELKPSFYAAKSKITSIITNNVYLEILELDSKEDASSNEKKVLSEIKRALVNLLMVEYSAFMYAGKGKEDKPFKYELNERKDKFLDYAFAALDELLQGLDVLKLTGWEETASYRKRAAALLNYDDFRGVSGFQSYYFFYRIQYLIEGITDSEILSIVTPEEIDENLKTKVIRAITYLSLADAVREFDYTELPSPIRNRLRSEYTSKSGGELKIKEDIAYLYESKGEKALDAIKLKIEARRLPIGEDVPDTLIENDNTEDDKFYFPG